jgi:hypothetical protein
MLHLVTKNLFVEGTLVACLKVDIQVLIWKGLM